MKLFTKQIDNQLFSQYPLGADLSKQKVVAKIFNPYGRGTWYIINSDPNDPDYLWAIVDLFEVEVGSVSRMELDTIKVPPFRLGLERDMSFTPKNAQEVYDGLLEGKRFEQGGRIEDENKQMVLNQAEGFEHHAEELEEAAKKADHVPAWVVAQSAVASSKLSDITHYLDGENEQKREMKEGEEYANGGMMAKGGVIGNYELMPYIKGVNDTYNPKYQAKEYFEGTKDDAIEKANSMLSAEIGMVQVSIVNPKATNVLNRTKKIATVVYKDGGYMEKGGSVDNWVLYDNDTDEIISFHKSAKSAKSAANKILDAPIPKHKEVGFMLESNWNKEKEAIKKAQELRKHNKMAMGGVTFKQKVKAVKSSLLKRKKVSPSVQKDYGKTYSKKEAQESAERIVGAMTAKERLMKSMKKGKK
jgi:hypothetical protein